MQKYESQFSLLISFWNFCKVFLTVSLKSHGTDVPCVITHLKNRTRQKSQYIRKKSYFLDQGTVLWGATVRKVTSPANLTPPCYAVKATALPDVPLSQDSYQLMSKFSSLSFFWKIFCVFKFISVFLICTISTSNGFSFCIYAFRNKGRKLYCYFPLCFT